ncbi:hypothetical protein CDD82_3305 [Ophiocordyceps australis]|uniref:Autophagy protein 5 n=1 Tax=Ophiocordyceps australis TaxID=1399860 RepID=A0A2C5XQC3_9HYPO|nr:hypothetical protein CDD82_3305 [Ophiocordyceps australis]
MTDSIAQTLWQARIPVAIRHASSSQSAVPLVTSVPRFSYLAQLQPRLTLFFPGAACTSFHFEEVQLRNLPVGLLVDLYRPSLPWQLVVGDGVAWDIGDTFLNSVKEADFVRNGNANQIMKMSKEHTTQLWESVLDNDYASFSKINSRLLDAATALKNVPLRVYIPWSPTIVSQPPLSSSVPVESASFKVIQALITPTAPDGKPKLLGHTLRDLMPKLFPSSKDAVLASAMMHGAPVPLTAPIEELMKEAAYPDGWLSLVVVVSAEAKR